MNIKIKIIKTDTPKGGYCGCGLCRAGLLAQYKNDGYKVDGIIPNAEVRFYLSSIRKMGLYLTNKPL